MGDKRDKFKDILFDLSKVANPNEEIQKVEQCKKDLEILYSSAEGFRHYYSDILAILITLKKNSPGSEELLVENIKYLVNIDEVEGKPNKNINKLYDHINLEMIRLTYMESNFLEAAVNKNLRDLNRDVNVIKVKNDAIQGNLYKAMEKNDELNKRISKYDEQISGLQKEHINILGIFAGIVLSFVGGAIFTSSVLQNIGVVSIGRLVLVLTLVGLVLINGIYGLLYYVYVLTKNHRNDIYKIKTFKVLAPILIINLICYNIGAKLVF